MLGSTIFVVSALAVAWLCVLFIVLTLCRMAARADAEIASMTQSPRRPRTWGTVRSKILTSPQSDQLATYR